jgi:hypothetical protein
MKRISLWIAAAALLLGAGHLYGPIAGAEPGEGWGGGPEMSTIEPSGSVEPPVGGRDPGSFDPGRGAGFGLGLGRGR